MLEVGTHAPDFTLPDKDGNPVTLSSFLGKRVVLYFYPRDNTPGCTRQACAYAPPPSGNFRPWTRWSSASARTRWPLTRNSQKKTVCPSCSSPTRS